MHIELAAEEDLARIVAIYDWAVDHTTATFSIEPEPVNAWILRWRETSESYPWLVARSPDAVLGFARATPHRPRGAYRWTAEVSVYVDPGHHGRGVATALYAELIATLRSQGFVTLLAGVTAGNESSERLHARAGFTRCGTFHRAGWKMGRWNDVGWWELHLQPAEEPPAIRSVAEVRARPLLR